MISFKWMKKARGFGEMDAPEVGGLRGLALRAADLHEVFILRPNSESASSFKKKNDALKEKILIAEEDREFDALSQKLEANAEEFGEIQRKEVDALIHELGNSVRDALDSYKHSVDVAGESITEIQDLNGSLSQIQHAKSLDEAKAHLTKGLSSLRAMVSKQTQRRDAMQATYESQLRKMQVQLEKLQKESSTDALTGLANRAAFERHFAKVVSAMRSTQDKGSLALMDLDGFKALNDTHGHRAGDAALIAFGTRLRQSTGEDAFLVRLGGDEFVVVHKLDTESLGRLLVKLDSSLKDKPVYADGKVLNFGTSFGITEINGDSDLSKVMAEADGLMYQHKRARKQQRVA